MASNPLFDNDKDLLSTEEMNESLGDSIQAAIRHASMSQIHVTQEDKDKWNQGLNERKKTATRIENGLMSNTDKAKLDLIEEGANNYSHPLSGVVAGTYSSVSVDSQGHVLRGETKAQDSALFNGENPSAFARVNSPQFTGTPTTPTPTGENEQAVVNVDYVKNSADNRSVYEGNVAPTNHYRFWVDTSTTPNLLKYYSDALSAWVEVGESTGTASATTSTGSPIAISSYAPDFTYDLWYNTLNHLLYRKEEIVGEEIYEEPVEEPTTDTGEEPTTDEPVMDEPVVEPTDTTGDETEPSTGDETEPTTDEPITDPVIDEPVEEEPTEPVVTKQYRWVPFKYYHIGSDMPENESVIWYDKNENELRVYDTENMEWITIPFISYATSTEAPPVDCIWMDPVTNELKYKYNDEWIPYLGNQVKRYVKDDVIGDFVPKTPCMYGELDGNSIKNIFMKDIDGTLAFFKQKSPFVVNKDGNLDQLKIVDNDIYYPAEIEPKEITEYTGKIESINELTNDILFAADDTKIYVYNGDAYKIATTLKPSSVIGIIVESESDILQYMTTDNYQVLNTIFILKNTDGTTKCWTLEQNITESGDVYFAKKSHDSVLTLDKNTLITDRSIYTDDKYPYRIYWYDEENDVMYEKKCFITKFSSIIGKGVTILTSQLGLDEVYKDDAIICLEDNKVFEYGVKTYKKIGDKGYEDVNFIHDFVVEDTTQDMSILLTDILGTDQNCELIRCDIYEKNQNNTISPVESTISIYQDIDSGGMVGESKKIVDWEYNGIIKAITITSQEEAMNKQFRLSGTVRLLKDGE